MPEPTDDHQAKAREIWDFTHPLNDPEPSVSTINFIAQELAATEQRGREAERLWCLTIIKSFHEGASEAVDEHNFPTQAQEDQVKELVRRVMGGLEDFVVKSPHGED